MASAEVEPSSPDAAGTDVPKKRAAKRIEKSDKATGKKKSGKKSAHESAESLDGQEPISVARGADSSSTFRATSVAGTGVDDEHHCTFTISLTRDIGKPLGLDLDLLDASAPRVTAVLEDGDVPSWNKTCHAEQQLKACDYIVAVNGANDTTTILKRLKLDSKLEVTIQRATEFRVHISKRDAVLGIDFTYTSSGTSLLIRTVLGEGAFHDWNAGRDSDVVKANDRIVEVNATRGTCWELIDRMKSSDELDILISPAPSYSRFCPPARGGGDSSVAAATRLSADVASVERDQVNSPLVLGVGDNDIVDAPASEGSSPSGSSRSCERRKKRNGIAKCEKLRQVAKHDSLDSINGKLGYDPSTYLLQNYSNSARKALAVVKHFDTQDLKPEQSEACGAASDRLFETMVADARITVLGTSVMRAGESLESPEVTRLHRGDNCIVIALGAESKRRIYVRSEAGVEGWISCTKSSGRPLLCEYLPILEAEPTLSCI